MWMNEGFEKLATTEICNEGKNIKFHAKFVKTPESIDLEQTGCIDNIL